MEDRLCVWEEEGGALIPTPAGRLTGTASQIEWAERIRAKVNGEFDRVANVLAAVARNQSEHDRSDTQKLIEILEEKRAQVMINPRAGYFIHDWQELTDQVRRMIMNDARYKTIKGS